MTRLNRQSFLGPASDQVLGNSKVGIVGLGGGGSHLAQQFAHIGIGKYVLVDPQTIDTTNTNRLVGGTLEDVCNEESKINIAARTIMGLEPMADITRAKFDWVDAIEDLRTCDVILGAVDSLVVKEQLESFSRKNLIPYIDVGMTVTEVKSEYLISGQVIRSMPGHPCMRCLGFITPEKLKVDAELYGDAGENPQVVWPNGLLASLAVGLCVDLLTPWCNSDELVYLTYDGNRGIVRQSPYVKSCEGSICTHYPPDEVGQPRFKARSNHLNLEDAVKVAASKSPAIMGKELGWVKRGLQFLGFR